MNPLYNELPLSIYQSHLSVERWCWSASLMIFHSSWLHMRGDGSTTPGASLSEHNTLPPSFASTKDIPKTLSSPVFGILRQTKRPRASLAECCRHYRNRLIVFGWNTCEVVLHINPKLLPPEFLCPISCSTNTQMKCPPGRHNISCKFSCHVVAFRIIGILCSSQRRPLYIYHVLSRPLPTSLECSGLFSYT